MQIYERLARYGITSLSDEEVLALLLETRRVTDSSRVLKQLRRFLEDCSDPQRMMNMELAELMETYGFPEKKAMQLSAILEFTRRMQSLPVEKKPQIRSVEDIARLVRPQMQHLDHEQFRVLVLDVKNQVLANVCLYQGTVNSSTLRTAEIFRPAIVRNASKVIAVHNHPTGDPAPSPEDIAVTRQLVKAGELLDIELLDHLILGNPRFLSLKDFLRW